MPLLARFLSCVLSASALYCAPAVGQLGYHIEIADEKTGQVAFGNDTDVAIEAYHVSAQCGPAGTKFQYDSLETYGDHLGFAIPKGWHSPTHLYLPISHLASGPSRCIASRLKGRGAYGSLTSTV